MADYLERPVSKAAIWSRRLAWFSVVLFLTAGTGHRYGWLETPGFLVVGAIVAALAALALCCAAIGFSRLWNYGDFGGRDVTVAVILASLVLAPFMVMAYRGAIYPALNDISTDLDLPPDLAAARQARSKGMNRVVPPTEEQRKLQLENYPEMTGRRYDLPFARVVNGVEQAVKANGWTVLKPANVEDGGETSVEAVAYTELLGFPSDVAIRLTDEGDSVYVDMRSASRYGDWDFGDNAARIAAFMDKLDADFSALAAVVPEEPAEEEPEGIPVPEPRPEG